MLVTVRSPPVSRQKVKQSRAHLSAARRCAAMPSSSAIATSSALASRTDRGQTRHRAQRAADPSFGGIGEATVRPETISKPAASRYRLKDNASVTSVTRLAASSCVTRFAPAARGPTAPDVPPAWPVGEGATARDPSHHGRVVQCLTRQRRSRNYQRNYQASVASPYRVRPGRWAWQGVFGRRSKAAMGHTGCGPDRLGVPSLCGLLGYLLRSLGDPQT